MFPHFHFRGRRAPIAPFIGSLFLACLLNTSLLGRDDDPREITIEQPDGTQETYILLGTGTTNYEGYNFPSDILLSKSDFDENVPAGQIITLGV